MGTLVSVGKFDNRTSYMHLLNARPRYTQATSTSRGSRLSIVRTRYLEVGELGGELGVGLFDFNQHPWDFVA